MKVGDVVVIHGVGTVYENQRATVRELLSPNVAVVELSDGHLVNFWVPNLKQVVPTTCEFEKAAAIEAETPITAGCIKGVGRTDPIVKNERGGSQSAVQYRCDLLPARATLEVAGVLHHGAIKYGENNWRQIEVGDHINHALIHLYALLAGDKQDDHLAHAACRLLMAMELELAKGGDSA